MATIPKSERPVSDGQAAERIGCVRSDLDKLARLAGVKRVRASAGFWGYVPAALKLMKAAQLAGQSDGQPVPPAVA